MPIISVNSLHKQFKVNQKPKGFINSLVSFFHPTYTTVSAINNLNFEIEKGELIGFIGPNGAGKTTTLKCLSGLLYPTSGDVKVMGFNPWDRKPEFQKQFSLVMGQKNQLWWDLPPIETFKLNKEIYEIPTTKYEQTLKELTHLLDLEEVLNTQVRKLSLGQRMKCELVAALLHQPKVLFLDEPTIGLDVVMQKTMRDFIQKYNQEYQATIILTSHYMEDVKELCKRVIVIDHGQIMFDGKLQEVIDKYARNKILTVTFDSKVSLERLKSIGEIKEYHQEVAKILVERKIAPAKAAKLLEDFPVIDLNIEEPSIEAIIRELFQQKSYS